MQRMHAVLTELFILQDGGATGEAQAFTAQALKCIHQTALDEGDWRLGWRLLGIKDPLERSKFAGSETDMEVLYTHMKTLNELEDKMKKRRGEGWASEDRGGGEEGEGGAGGGQLKGAGKTGTK